MRTRQRLRVTGRVQGVGFRPFVHRLADDLVLGGFVRNEPGRVHIEVEGPADDVDRFAALLVEDPPPLASIDRVAAETVPALGDAAFRIAASDTSAPDPAPARVVPPDVATCDACVAELFDPADRRYRHPFITCTDCGPRYTIITALPYDRPSTTMAGFELCPACQAEYDDPTDRRFHAQPLACRSCGPSVRHDRAGRVTTGSDGAVVATQVDLRAGRIVAVKGLGGFHLACDALDDRAVARLRRRKHRPDKPLAVMVADLDAARALAEVDPVGADALQSPTRPIVLLPARADSPLAPSVAPGVGTVGVMLPSTPLHHLLFHRTPAGPDDPPAALVMTSGNRAEEPLCFEDDDARRRLGDIADAFCDHDRPIHVPCDDSVVRVIDGVAVPLRRSRGLAPAPLPLPFETEPTLAVGGDLKNVFALARGEEAWLSQHVGDLGSLETQAAFEGSVDALSSFHQVHAERLAVDAHPGYHGTRWAGRAADGRPVVAVQHHHAHLAALMAEHGRRVDERLLGFVFDGTGHGTDGTTWGGEVLLAGYAEAERVGSLAPVPLPGGDAAARNPCRVALAHLASAGIGWDPSLAPVAACREDERAALEQQLRGGRAVPRSSSMGRLFDAVASILGLAHRSTYEGQAAMALESLASTASAPADGMAFAVGDGRIDPAPVLRTLVDGLEAGRDRATLALAFHHAVVDAMVRVVLAVRAERPVPAVGCTGGCFQNELLTELATERLAEAGFEVLTHRLVPPNDGGIALGQLAVAAARAGAPPSSGSEA